MFGFYCQLCLSEASWILSWNYFFDVAKHRALNCSQTFNER